MQSQMFIQTVSELQQPGQGTAQKQAASSILLLKPDFWCKFPSVKYGVCKASQLLSAHVTPDPVKFLFSEVLSVSLPRALFLILQNGFCRLSVSESLLIFPMESPLEARKLHKSLAMMISYVIILLRPKALVIVQCEG